MTTIQKYHKASTTLFHGDALEVLDQSVKDGTVNLIFADPPYNLGKQFSSSLDKWDSEEAYIAWCEKWLSLCLKKLLSRQVA